MDLAIQGNEVQQIQQAISFILGDDVDKLNVYQRIEKIESVLKQYDQVEIPVTHLFSGDVYIRQIMIPKGTLLTSRYHKFDQVDIMLTGEMSIVSNDGIVKIKAPFVGYSKPGMKRIGYAHEDVLWMDVHPTKETDIAKIEAELFTDDYREIANLVDREDYDMVLLESGFTHEVARIQSENEEDQIQINLDQYQVKIEPSTIEGLGVFAVVDIPSRQMVAPARIDGKRTQLGRYTNHSINPNAKMVFSSDNQIDLIAIRDISASQEITISYRESLALQGIECEKGDSLCLE